MSRLTSVLRSIVRRAQDLGRERTDKPGPSRPHFLPYRFEPFRKRGCAIGTIALSLGMVVIPGSVSASPIFFVDNNGKLTGAFNVEVGDGLFNVTFRDGTCADVFGDCVTSSFAFQTLEDARSASQALLDQVFVDGPPFFDSNPALTFGCAPSELCDVLTPFLADTDHLSVFVAENRALGAGADAAFPWNGYIIHDVDNSPNRVWAQWSPQPVPEPTSLALVGCGLGLAALRRRRRETVNDSMD